MKISKNAANWQANDIFQIISNTISCFTIFIARFGPYISISLPMICIEFSTFFSDSAKRYMWHINRFASLFDAEHHRIYFIIGESRPAELIWNYVRVPLSCSISSADIDAVTSEGTTETLGPYIYVWQNRLNPSLYHYRWTCCVLYVDSRVTLGACVEALLWGYQIHESWDCAEEKGQ
jgi:hypothetical protein